MTNQVFVSKDQDLRDTRIEWMDRAIDCARLQKQEKLLDILSGARTLVVGGCTSTSAIKLVADISGYTNRREEVATPTEE